jgi:hypothetical protein
MINRPPPVFDGPKTALYTPTLLGHRGAYLDLTSSLFAGRRLGGWQMIWTRDPAFHLMIEDGFAGFVGMAILRAVLGRRTVGLLFRVLPTLHDMLASADHTHDTENNQKNFIYSRHFDCAQLY